MAPFLIVGIVAASLANGKVFIWVFHILGFHINFKFTDVNLQRQDLRGSLSGSKISFM